MEYNYKVALRANFGFVTITLRREQLIPFWVFLHDSQLHRYEIDETTGLSRILIFQERMP